MTIRRAIPISVQLQVAKRQLAGFLNCTPAELRLDHHPALQLRPLNEAGTDIVPPANDPYALQYLSAAVHDEKTRGRKASTVGSDIHAIYKTRRIAKDPSGGAEFRNRLLTREPRPEKKHKRKIPSRPFSKAKP